MSTLGSSNIQKLHLHIPPSGSWMADCVLLDSPAPSGAQTLTVADLALAGTVLPGRGGEDAPDQPHVVVMGGAGWAKRAARAGSYRVASGGVRLSTVLRDLAGLAGEPYDAPPEAILGSAYSWNVGTPLRTILGDLVRIGAIPTWRVAPSGRTRFDAWPSTGEAGKLGEIPRRDLAQGMRRIALDSAVAGLLPGALVEGALVRRLVITETSKHLTAETYES